VIDVAIINVTNLWAIGGTEDWQTFVVLTGMVGISVVIRFTQEMSSAISAEALKKRVEQRVTVRRPMETDGHGGEAVEMKRSLSSQSSDELKTWKLETVPFTSIVPGDVVELAAGSLIPGDLRVIRTLTLLVNQGVLTGESMAVEKTWKPFTPKKGTAVAAVAGNSDAGEDGDVEHLHRDNLCFMGTAVESGSAAALVLCTGER
jgi:Mg2+-importing ATPase